MKKLFLIGGSLFVLSLGIGLNHYLKPDVEVLNGETYKWENSQGKWTVVNYFAEWCAPCLRELPELNDFHHQYSDSIRLFAVSYDPLSNSALLALQKKYDIQFPVVTHLETLPWGHAPSALPATFILGPDGELKRQLKGEQTAEELKSVIETLQRL